MSSFSTRFSLGPMLTAIELLCLLAAWVVGVAAMWSSDRYQASRATSEKSIASSHSQGDSTSRHGALRVRLD